MNDMREIAEKIVARGASINPLYVCGEIVSVPELAAAYLDLLKRTESHVLRSPEPLGDAAFRFPYTVTLSVDEDGDVIARIPALKGCVAHGSNVAEALHRLKEVQRLWIADCVESGDVVPVEKDTK